MKPEISLPKLTLAERRIRAALRAFCILAALLNMIAWKRAIDPDGTSYLDLAHAYLRQDWHNALSSYWSPLYPWLLALLMKAFHPGLRWELLQMHLISFVSFLAMLICWEWLVAEYERWQGPPAHRVLVMAAGYGSVAWSGLKLNGMLFTSGDIVVTALMIASGALLIRIRAVGAAPGRCIALGAILGFCFLAKAAAASIAPVIMIETAVLAGLAGRRSDSERLSPRELARAFAAGLRSRSVYLVPAVALLVVAPFVTALSIRSRRFMLTSTGAINYSWQVTGMSVEGYKESAFQPVAPRHPFRRLLDEPPVLSFQDHPIGTFPIHFDPAWWCEGYPVKLNLRRQLFILGNSLEYCATVFVECPALWLGLLCACVSLRIVGKRVADVWFIWLPALTMCFSYCLIYVLTRYIAGCFALLGFALLTTVWTIDLSRVERRMMCLTVAAISILGLWSEIFRVPADYIALTLNRGMPWGYHNVAIADKMNGEGLKKGDGIAYIGNSLSAAWASLQGVTIVAMVPARIFFDDTVPGRPQKMTYRNTDLFWSSNRAVQKKVLDAFRSAGATWVFADEVPPWADTSAWKEVGAAPNVRADDFPSTYAMRLDRIAASETDAASAP